jgi:hypothetical protein
MVGKVAQVQQRVAEIKADPYKRPANDDDAEVIRRGVGGAVGGAMILLGGVCLAAGLSPLGLILGICALLQSERDHFSSFLGIGLNGLTIIGLVVLYLR